VSAIPVSGQDLDFKFTNLFIRNQLTKQNLELNELSGTIIIPKYLPEDMTKNALSSWQIAEIQNHRL